MDLQERRAPLERVDRKGNVDLRARRAPLEHVDRKANVVPPDQRALMVPQAPVEPRALRVLEDRSV